MIPWKRAIALADMDAFFTSVEQLDDPFLRSRAVVITSHQQGSCVISCSYEARQYGIKVGMSLLEAKQHCSLLVQRVSRSQRYAEISDRIIHALKTQITPVIEQSSIDEAYLELTAEQGLYPSPQHMAEHIREVIYQSSGLSASVGLSGDKTTAKFAAKQNKPHGYMIIPPYESKLALADVPVSELCGIGHGMTRYLAQLGVHTCKDMQSIPISVLSKRFGRIGRRIWYMCLGADPHPVNSKLHQPKSLGHSKIIPPGTSNEHTLFSYCHYLTLRLAKRLRNHDLKSAIFLIGIKSKSRGWLSERITLDEATNNNPDLYKLFTVWINKTHYRHEVISKIFITATNLQTYSQKSLNNSKKKSINTTLDEIHKQFGLKGLMPARLIESYHDINPVIPFSYTAQNNLLL